MKYPNTCTWPLLTLKMPAFYLNNAIKIPADSSNYCYYFHSFFMFSLESLRFTFRFSFIRMLALLARSYLVLRYCILSVRGGPARNFLFL